MSGLNARLSVDNGAPLPFDLDNLVERVAERVAEIVADRLLEAFEAAEDDRWLTSREAAEHLAMTPTALDKLCAKRDVPFSQEGPGARRYFLASELDAWRRKSASP